MVNVSKRQIKKKVLLAISNHLSSHIVGIKTHSAADKFLSSLLTPAERMMLAKRFAAIFMLARGYSYSAIIKALKISHTTIAKIENDRDEGIYEPIIQCFPIPKKFGGAMTAQSSNFWTDLEELLCMGMPPMGRGRWRNLYKMTDRNY